MTQQPAQSLHNFPAQPTSFIGRAVELAQISETLAEPDCGLLTLVGSGGVGKSRLAIQVAAEVAAEFSDGGYFVPLQSISSSDSLLTTIIESLHFSPQGQETPRQQLLTHLHDKELLLVLDNFEQLLPHSTPDATNGGEQSLTLLSNILATAPAVTLLVTSREVLNLQGEWLFPLRGLAFPRIDQANDIEGYAAVQLFVERARQVRPDFSLAEEQAGVTRICRLVAGVPLALELAASWVRSLRCEPIAAEVEQNLGFLATRLWDVPERHRSLQAVFDHSWTLLTETERAVFKQLSVFRGSFRHAAASQIAGATLPVLSALVDKSLLRWEPETQYQLHELLRQYAAERLQESPEAVEEARQRHCAYYANFLHERFDDVLGGRQKKAAAEIELELDNVRLAWQWAVKQVEVEHIQKAAQTLSLVYQFQNRYLEGARAFEAATERLTSVANEPDSEQIDLTLVMILVDRAWFYIRLGWLDQAEAVVARCRTIYERLDRPPVAGHGTDPLLALGVIASIRGDYETAARLGEKVRQVSEAHDHLWNRQITYYLLARTALVQGEVEAARRYAQRAYTLTEETQDRWFMAYCHNELGHVARARGDYDIAIGHYETSYALRQEFDDSEGMAEALTHLGETALAQHDPASAEQLYRQSLEIYEETNDQGGIATALAGLGHATCVLGDYQAARQYFQQALQRARNIRFVPRILSIIAGSGELLLQSGAKERGIELLALAQHHPASDFETRAAAQQALAHHEADLSPEIFAAAIERGQSAELETVATTLQAELAALSDRPLTTDVATPAVPQADQSLPEPLTPRELEVLHHIARGRTNQEIADELFIVEGTVKAHASNIYGKLNVNNRTEAVARAKELNLL